MNYLRRVVKMVGKN